MNTYNKTEFNDLVNDIFTNAELPKVKILLLVNQDAKKWYDKTYTQNYSDITENTVYGISIDGLIDYEFKTGKIENLLKSFLLKVASKQTSYRLVEGYYKTVSIKNEVIDKIIATNKDRVSTGLFYTTLYGIGFWCIFSNTSDKEIAIKLHSFLRSKDISYFNEYSDAGWVYRFKINKKVEVHNELLNEFKTVNA